MATVGGLIKAVSWFPVEQIIKVLERLYEARRQIKRRFTRSRALVTLSGAHQMPRKLRLRRTSSRRYVSLRLKRMRSLVAQYAREIVHA